MVSGGGHPSPWLTHNFTRTRAAEFCENVFQNVGRRMTRIDEEFRNPLIRIIEQQQTTRRLSIAAGAADLLIIRLHGIGDVGMNYKPYLATIDSHPESVGCHDDALRRLHEPFLDGL